VSRVYGGARGRVILWGMSAEEFGERASATGAASVQEQARAADTADARRAAAGAEVGAAGVAVDAAGIPAALLEREVETEKRVTPLELFFDLVFVFAITQVSGLVSSSPDWTRLAEGLAIMAVLWFAWSGYAWLGNTANADEGVVRLLLIAAMGAMLIASLAVPHAFGSDALIFGVAYLVVRCLHLATYTYVARAEHDPELGRLVARLASTMLPAASLLVLAGALHGTARTACWVAALTVDYGGLLVRGVRGWRVTPGHFAERHGLIIIIALGESIVSLGVGADRLALDGGVIVASLFGLAVAAALWWAYFDVVAIVAERRLRHVDASEQALMARDSYTYLHLPMVAGIVVFAIGVKRTLIELGAHLEVVPASALCGGIALYLVALSAFKRRNIGTWNTQRLITAALLLAMIPLATAVPALLALGLVTAVACGLIGFEVIRYSETRQRIRHAQTD
jgi:low temperature requirement protein LtrA